MKELESFLKFREAKNLKLKPSKFVIGEEVEFGGALITSETVGTQNVVNILPKSQRVEGFQNLRRPKTKKEVQIFCGMMTSLQKWNPHVTLNASVMRAATGEKDNKPFEWTEEMEAEFQFLKKTMKQSLKLSPYNPAHKLRLIIHGSRIIGAGFALIQYINDDNVKEGIKIINAK